jgi:multicomponent K+:H+ antiporter subunit E
VRWVRKLAPAPLSSAALLVLWLALAREVTLGRFLVGLALAIAAPIVTARLRPVAVRVRRPAVVVRFILRVACDVLAANLGVAFGVLASPWRKPRAHFVVIPLDLRDPHGLAALAMVVTIVPGTVWSELALDRSALMLHVWDVDEAADFVARFKARYEGPLREIFE